MAINDVPSLSAEIATGPKSIANWRVAWKLVPLHPAEPL
jgi:hypothetical protein